MLCCGGVGYGVVVECGTMPRVVAGGLHCIALRCVEGKAQLAHLVARDGGEEVRRIWRKQNVVVNKHNLRYARFLSRGQVTRQGKPPGGANTQGKAGPILE